MSDSLRRPLPSATRADRVRSSRSGRLPHPVLRFEHLEDRAVPAAVLGLGAANTLVPFDTDTPGTVGTPVTVTNLVGGDTLVGIDYRTSTGQLYGLGSGSRLYRIDAGSGAATQVGTGTFMTAAGSAATLTGTAFGFDFNPVIDRIRVVSNTGQNLVVNPDTAAVTVVAPLAYYAGDADIPQDENFGTAPNVRAVAYLPTLDIGNGPVTTLYGIDPGTDLLVTIGGGNGENPQPNTGALLTQPTNFLGFAAATQLGFDITPTNDAFVTTSAGGATELYALNLTTGNPTDLGVVGGGVSLRALAVLPPQTGAGTLQFEAGTYSLNENGSVTVRVLRVGGATGPVTIDFATVDGTAKGGVNYVPVNGTLSFANGVTAQTITIPAVGDLSGTPGDPATTFTVVLTNPTGGAALSATTTTTVTISETALPPAPPPPVAPPSPVPPPVPVSGPTVPPPSVPADSPPGTTVPPIAPAPAPQAGPTRYYAVAAGAGGGPQVVVYSAATGAVVRSFYAYDPSFTGGVTVATGDVNGDGVDDVIVGAGPGGGPNVKVFDGRSGDLVSSIFAYEPTFTGGVIVAAGDVNGDGFDDVIVGSGIGGGPRVHVFSGADGSDLLDFFAYESTFRGGVNVASGNFDAKAYDDIVTSPGFGGGPRVVIFDGMSLNQLASYFAFDPNSRAGVNAATGQFEGGDVTDVIAGTGTGSAPAVQVFRGTTATSIQSLNSFPGFSNTGVRVAAKTDRFGNPFLIAAPGPGGSSTYLTIDPATGAVLTSVTPYPANFTGGVYVG